MAKDKKTVTVGLNMMLLSAIATANAAGQFIYVSKDEGTPFLQHQPALIEVNPNMADPNDATKIAAAITEAGKALLAAPAAQGASTVAPQAQYGIIKGAVLPEAKKRFGGGGAPTVYPFETMEIGDSFFVPVSEKHPDPLKTLGSTVSSINHKYSVETGETRTKKVAKRGDDKKPILENGNKVMVDTVVKLRKPERKFTIRAVEAGKTYGSFEAKENGVLIARVALPTA